MAKPFAFAPDLAGTIEVPANGILSRTIHEDAFVKAVLFGFSAGQELSEHTASMPAEIIVLSGQATLTLGDQTIEAGPGSWIHMTPGLKHSVRTTSPLVMLLILIRGVRSGAKGHKGQGASSRKSPAKKKGHARV
jgi:quercetin dioxygenase-like cupin family protein